MKIRIYDNGGKTLDRYIIVDMEPTMMVNHNTHYYVGASETGADLLSDKRDLSLQQYYVECIVDDIQIDADDLIEAWNKGERPGDLQFF